MPARSLVLLATASCLWISCTSAGDSHFDSGVGCVYAGVMRAQGAQFPGQKACSVCVCAQDVVICKATPCAGQDAGAGPSESIALDGGVCVFGGRTYHPGEPVSYGCETCRCTDGWVACTACRTDGGPCRVSLAFESGPAASKYRQEPAGLGGAPLQDRELKRSAPHECSMPIP